MNEVNEHVKQVEQHLPLIGAILTGVFGIATAGWKYMQLRRLRLHRIENSVHEIKVSLIEHEEKEIENHTELKEELKQVKQANVRTHKRIDDLYNLLVKS